MSSTVAYFYLWFLNFFTAFAHREWDSRKYHPLNSPPMTMTPEQLTHYFRATDYRLTVPCISVLMVDQLGSSCGFS